MISYILTTWRGGICYHQLAGEKTGFWRLSNLPKATLLETGRSGPSSADHEGQVSPFQTFQSALMGTNETTLSSPSFLSHKDAGLPEWGWCWVSTLGVAEPVGIRERGWLS